MKHIKLIFTILITCLVTSITFSQELRDIEDPNYPEEGKYYQDTNNLLNPFVGTYLYTNGNTSFEIILEKKINSSSNNYLYQDMLIGAYRYVENGVEKVNVLSDLDNNYSDGRLHKITGRNIMRGNILGQDDAEPNEAWIYGLIGDPVSNTSSKLFIRKIMVNGQEAIKIGIYYTPTMRHENEPEPIAISFPSQEFILLKQ